MTGASSRRGEAHLWLLLEEALTAIRRGGAEVAEVRRNFNAVTAALAAAEVIDGDVARRLRLEFGDVLAVRGLIPVAEFVGPPDDAQSNEAATTAPAVRVPNGAVIWLEAEIERHLDLLAGFDPTTRPTAGLEALRILGGPVRAFEAARALGPEGRALVADLAVTLRVAGFDIRRPAEGTAREGRERRSWSAFLRSAPPPVPEDFTPEQARRCSVTLGDIGRAALRISSVAWTGAVIEIVSNVRHPPLDLTMLDAAWMCRVVDERGGLHLGQGVRLTHRGGTSARFLLRPGLPPDAAAVDVRVTSGARRVEATVDLVPLGPDS